MCTNLRLYCTCRKHSANIMNRDNILPTEVIRKMWCPECSGIAAFEPDRMVKDNGWMIEYRMDMARNILAGKFGDSRSEISPEFLFDEGYSSWNGFTPTELEESLAERSAIRKECGSNMLVFMTKITSWGKDRVKTLSDRGWRKAQAAV